MRRIAILLTAVGTALLLAGGAALAATVVCDGGRCVGTNNVDTIRGTKASEQIFGRDGNDSIYGNYGSDVIYGGAGSDTMVGGYGNDRMYGGPGPDNIDGNPGGDYVYAAGDGERDSISCGLGNDTAVVDNLDLSRQSFEDFVRLTSCENVTAR